MSVRLLPDAEQVVIDYLRGHADVMAQVGTRVFWQLPAGVTFPAVLVTRLGGRPVIEEHLDAARIQVDVLGGTKKQCWTAAETIRAALVQARHATHPLAVVTDVETESAPAWLPDRVKEGAPDRPRYVASYLIYLHPHRN